MAVLLQYLPSVNKRFSLFERWLFQEAFFKGLAVCEPVHDSCLEVGETAEIFNMCVRTPYLPPTVAKTTFWEDFWFF